MADVTPSIMLILTLNLSLECVCVSMKPAVTT